MSPAFKRASTLIIAVPLLCGLLAGCAAGTSIPTTPVATTYALSTSQTSPYDWQVQVWEAGSFVANGVVVGDGSLVLTVLDYSTTAPADMQLEVIAPGGGEYAATVQVIDSRTSAALLAVDGAGLPVAPISTLSGPYAGQAVDLDGWQSVYGNPDPVFTASALAATGNTGLESGLNLPPGVTAPVSENDLPLAGAAVLDGDGRVAGLLGIFHIGISPWPSPPGIIPPVINIESARELLSPDAASQPWANGPLAFEVANDASLRSNVLPSNYAAFVSGLQNLFGTMGDPVPPVDLPQNYWQAITASDDLFSVIYASPIELRNAAGEVVARARWVGIRYNIFERPFYLFYGNDYINITGGFTLLASLGEVQAVVPPNIAPF